MSPATHRLCALLRRPISAADRVRARWHVLDWYACARHGARDDRGLRWAAALQSLDGSGAHAAALPKPGAEGEYGWPGTRAFSVGPDFLSPDLALRFNAALGNIGEMDDVHRRSVLHPGPVVIPVALATARLSGAPMDALLDAVIRGYETTIRVGEALGLAHYAFYHSTATAGVFGAAAAAASLLELNEAQWISALGNAGSVAGGLWQLRHEEVDSKQWHNAHAASTGQQAARLAAQGISGPAGILDGPQGLLAAASDGGDVDAVDRDPQAPWRLHDCSFKPWPACRHAHPVIDAALQLRHAVDVSSIAAVRVESYQDALTFCDRPRPQSIVDAQFSLQYCAAVALRQGAPTLEDFNPGAWERPELEALADRVEVSASAAFTRCYPEHFGAAITVVDGRGAHRTEVSDTLGDPARPLDESAHLQKLNMLLRLENAAATERWAQSVLALEGNASSGELCTALRVERP